MSHTAALRIKVVEYCAVRAHWTYPSAENMWKAFSKEKFWGYFPHQREAAKIKHARPGKRSEVGSVSTHDLSANMLSMSFRFPRDTIFLLTVGNQECDAMFWLHTISASELHPYTHSEWVHPPHSFTFQSITPMPHCQGRSTQWWRALMQFLKGLHALQGKVTIFKVMFPQEKHPQGRDT